jgi:hypothetical protein
MSAEESIVCCDVIDVLTMQSFCKDGCRHSWKMRKQNIFLGVQQKRNITYHEAADRSRRKIFSIVSIF